MSHATYYTGDVLEVLAKLPENSVDLILTSPPFLALRSYLPADHPDKALEGGSQSTPGEFIDWLLDVVEACDRVLAPHGSMCIELGDTFAGSGGAGGDYGEDGLREGQPKFRQNNLYTSGYSGGRHGNDTKKIPGAIPINAGSGWPSDKSLTLIPETFRFALAYGFNPHTGRQTTPWRIRNVIRWVRPNPPVGSLGDKFRPATSEMVVFCRTDEGGRKRYFDLDAVREPFTGINADKQSDGWQVTDKAKNSRDNAGAKVAGSADVGIRPYGHPAGAPPLDWWEIPTHPYPGAHYACVDADTEALTPSGWKRHDQLSDGDTIAAYDATVGTITWQPATFHRYPFSGDLVAIDKRETVQRLTPNHRVLHMTRNGNVHTKRADQAVPSWRLPVAAPWDIEPTGGPGVEMAALLGWYITEGNERSGNTVRIYQSESANPKHCARIRDLLDAVRADYSERRRVRPIGSTISPRESVEVHWTIRGTIAESLRALAPGKALTCASLAWSDAECEALLDALIDGDGHTRQSGRRAFVQLDRGTVDAFQALVARLGMRSTISERLEGGYSVTIGERRWLSLRGTDGSHEPIGTEYYDGIVWCPSVPSSYWLARRCGRPFITGNTWPPALCVKPIKAMSPERVCRTCGEPSRRVVEKTEEYAAHRARSSEAGTDYRERRNTEGWRAEGRPSNERQDASYTTLGWTSCGHDDDRPGVVLDPFGGSGTTGAVAVGHGRDAWLIDLDDRNVELARERIGPLFFEEGTL